MLKNYLIISFRNIWRNKTFAAINILGLTIGITVCMMIFLFISHEFSVDEFHIQGKNMYRVMRGIANDGKQSNVAYLSGPYAPALLNDFKSEIKKAVRVNPTDGLVRVGNKSFHEKKIIDTDADFFSLFSFPLVRGNPLLVLTDPSSVVLTESVAKKYFGSIDNAMNKIIELDKKLVLKVTGIAKDVPSNSHLDFDIVIPISNYKDSGFMNGWINNGLYTYVLLAPGVNKSALESRFSQFMEKYMGNDMKKYGFHFVLSLTPLKDIYFENSSFDSVRHGDKTVVYIFLSIAILILLIACINFINLSTIRAAERSKEVGMRKVLGAVRTNLIWQFIGESVLLTLLSCVLSVVLLFLFMPLYNNILGYSLTIPLNTLPVYLFFIGIIFIVGFLSGSYPAFFLSAFSPVQALKGRLRLGKSGVIFRQALVVVQFSISVILIIGTIIIARQMNFIKNKQLGYDQTQTLMIPIDNNDIYNNMNVFKTILQNEKNVESVSFMSGEPGGFFDINMFDLEGYSEKWQARTEFADFDYVKTLGLKIIEGRDFSAQYPTDSTEAVLINRTAALKFGWTPSQALGKWVQNTIRDNKKRRVIGVVEDFNFLSLKENIEALVIAPNDDRRVTLIKLKPGNLQANITAVKAAYDKIAPGYPLEYRFLDQQFEALYKISLQQQSILSVFAGLAILVACLGLFGLASFNTKKRFKEIGIRKVLGSSVRGIVVLLSKDLLKPVLIATCFAIPFGYLAMDKWLQNFAYKTALDWWIFGLAALITLGIALLTVSFQAIKAALANPVKSLRTE